MSSNAVNDAAEPPSRDLDNNLEESEENNRMITLDSLPRNLPPDAIFRNAGSIIKGPGQKTILDTSLWGSLIQHFSTNQPAVASPHELQIKQQIGEKSGTDNIHSSTHFNQPHLGFQSSNFQPQELFLTQPPHLQEIHIFSGAMARAVVLPNACTRAAEAEEEGVFNEKQQGKTGGEAEIMENMDFRYHALSKNQAGFPRSNCSPQGPNKEAAINYNKTAVKERSRDDKPTDRAAQGPEVGKAHNRRAKAVRSAAAAANISIRAMMKCNTTENKETDFECFEKDQDTGVVRKNALGRTNRGQGAKVFLIDNPSVPSSVMSSTIPPISSVAVDQGTGLSHTIYEPLSMFNIPATPQVRSGAPPINTYCSRLYVTHTQDPLPYRQHYFPDDTSFGCNSCEQQQRCISEASGHVYHKLQNSLVTAKETCPPPLTMFHEYTPPMGFQPSPSNLHTLSSSQTTTAITTVTRNFMHDPSTWINFARPIDQCPRMVQSAILPPQMTTTSYPPNYIVHNQSSRTEEGPEQRGITEIKSNTENWLKQRKKSKIDSDKHHCYSQRRESFPEGSALLSNGENSVRNLEKSSCSADHISNDDLQCNDTLTIVAAAATTTTTTTTEAEEEGTFPEGRKELETVELFDVDAVDQGVLGLPRDEFKLFLESHAHKMTAADCDRLKKRRRLHLGKKYSKRSRENKMQQYETLREVLDDLSARDDQLFERINQLAHDHFYSLVSTNHINSFLHEVRTFLQSRREETPGSDTDYLYPDST